MARGDDDLVTVREAADEFGVSYYTIWNLVARRLVRPAGERKGPTNGPAKLYRLGDLRRARAERAKRKNTFLYGATWGAS